MNQWMTPNQPIQKQNWIHKTDAKESEETSKNCARLQPCADEMHDYRMQNIVQPYYPPYLL